jgi:lipopolysaccharide export system protein LptA
MTLRRGTLRAGLPLIAALACAVPALGAPAPSTPAPPRAPAAAPGVEIPGLQTRDYQIETDQTQSNLNTGDFTMPHRVKFLRPGTDATADRAEGNFKRGTAILIGNVVVHDSGNAPEAGGESYAGNGPATLTCDRLEVDSKAKIYTAFGNVHFSQGTNKGSADRAVLDRNSNMLHLEGNVKLAQGDSSMAANNINYNLQNKDVTVTGAPVIIKQPVPPAVAGSPKPSPSPATKKR